jgi:negative regulator of flagellin synthesis FlgM
MKVEQSRSNPAQKNETSGTKQSGKAASAQEAKRTEKGSAGETDKASRQSGARAEISSKGKEFAAAKAAASDTPDVREDKVADLKRRIAEGSYKIDTESVADRMVDDHLRMSGIG